MVMHMYRLNTIKWSTLQNWAVIRIVQYMHVHVHIAQGGVTPIDSIVAINDPLSTLGKIISLGRLGSTSGLNLPSQ